MTVRSGRQSSEGPTPQDGDAIALCVTQGRGRSSFQRDHPRN